LKIASSKSIEVAARNNMSTMQVVRYFNNSDVRIERASVPEIQDGEALLRVEASGICGSDVMEWFRVPKSPRILGHEVGGTVVLSRSKKLAEGVRVVIRNQVYCGTCDACVAGHVNVCECSEEITPGGMAEYVRLPRAVIERGIWQVPDALPIVATALAEPAACVIHSQGLAQIQRRQCLVVFGCGVFGLLHIQLARNAGVKNIIAVEPNPHRQRLALKFGANVVVESSDSLTEAIRSINSGRLADMAVVCTGNIGAAVASFSAVGRYGSILFFGVPGPGSAFPLGLNEMLWRKELSLVSSYGSGSVPFSLPLDLMNVGVIDYKALISHQIPLAAAAEGFQLVCKASDSLKVVLTT
jgi:L-iditol 2-dehydrogenase